MKGSCSIAILFLLLFACSGGKQASSENDQASSGEKAKEQKGGEKDSDASQTEGEKSKSKKKGKNEADRFLYHSRTPCYGKCPVYTLRVDKDGKARLKVKRFLEPGKGRYTGTFDQKSIRRIKEKAQKIDFFNLEKVYDNKDVTDLPSRITELSFDGKEHRVKNRYGGPDKLEKLEKLIQKTVKQTEWRSAPSNE
ncbi:MAG: DUF6438 domain-containing protein [Flavobacteriales bacterium]